MASISTSVPIPLTRFQSISLQPLIYNVKRPAGLEIRAEVGFTSSNLTKKNSRKSKCGTITFRLFCCLQTSDEIGDKNEEKKEKETAESEQAVGRLQGTINSIKPVLSMMKNQIGTNYRVGLCIAVALVVVTIRAYLIGKSRSNHHGSVADLVKRGQLRSDRRGISRPLKYDDPFNNPLVKVSKNSSTVEMCGKVYRLAPVTLTEKEQSNHQKRRSRAYQWKRPTMFLKEGDSIPPDVDPDTVRWIPANHPFATTVNDIDEDLAQSNVNQKRGVPFRIRAEHEALQKKLETLQNEEKLNKVRIEPGNVRDFERPFKSFSYEQAEEKTGGRSSTPKSDKSTETKTSLDDEQNP